MKNFLQIATGIDVIPLMLALHRRPELWHADTYLRDYPQGPFGEVESIILRFPPRTVHETEEALREHNDHFDQHECIDQPVYKTLPEARKLVMALMARVEGERLGRVMINKIEPGGRIFPHADTPAHADYWERHHIVLVTNTDSLFRCGDELAHMAAGEAWWFENAIEHEVRNEGKTARIHLIIDVRCSQ